MRQKAFGNTGLLVSELGIGCSRLGGIGGSRAEEMNLLHQALDAGINFFDTSDLYAQGESERRLGQAFRKRREQVVLATKVGYCPPGQRRLLSRIKPLVRPLAQALGIRRSPAAAGRGGAFLTGGALAQNFSADYIVSAAEASLRRLGTDYIDIYQLHGPSRAVVDAGEYVEVLQRLQAQGKIRHFGIGAETVEDVLGFARHPGIGALQVPFNLLYPEALDALFPAAAQRGVGVIARSCFAAGLLSDALSEDELRERAPQEWQRILALRALAKEQGRSLLELSLQFSLQAAPTGVTILGMRTSAHLTENLRFFQAPRLTEAECSVLTGAAAGGRLRAA